VINQYRGICRDRLAYCFKSFQGMRMDNFPYTCIYFLTIHVHFLMSWKSSISKRRDLCWGKIQWFINDDGICLDSNLLTIVDNVVWITIFRISSNNDEHWSCNRGFKFGIRSASISLFLCSYFIS